MMSDIVNPRELDFAVIKSVSQAEIDRLPANRLGEGEQAIIALARQLNAAVAGLDDRQARQNEFKPIGGQPQALAKLATGYARSTR